MLSAAYVAPIIDSHINTTFRCELTEQYIDGVSTYIRMHVLARATDEGAREVLQHVVEGIEAGEIRTDEPRVQMRWRLQADFRRAFEGPVELLQRI